MKLTILLLLVTASSPALSKAESCQEVTQEDCETMTSAYEKYRECMERRRTKRSVSCYKDNNYDCDNCDCDTCSYNTNNCENCHNNDNTCCSQCCQRNSCKTYNCCHQTCRAECRSNSCRTQCKKKCQPYAAIAQQESEPIRTQSRTASNHNITTVIHLNNVINNTNLINLPVNVNNRVLNNITNEGSAASRTGTTGNCCMTVGPRQCIPQKSFPFIRCFHIRKRACGSMCTAPVVHYEKHEICDNDVNVEQPCRQQIIYVPQPQPRCAYNPSWPYVTCGNQQLQSCEGCYSHYVKREDVTRCSNFCYDDGYGVGPYYRQGPFYQPGFAHVPSCYQTGMCGNSGLDGLGYGNSYGYEGLPENGFPPIYPPQTYPFVVEDCENCTSPYTWDSPASGDPFINPQYKNFDSQVHWSNVSDRMLNIDASIRPLRSGRYAEIRIKSTREEDSGTTPPSNVTTERITGTTIA